MSSQLHVIDNSDALQLATHKGYIESVTFYNVKSIARD